MPCGIYWQQLHEVERALTTMKRYGIPEEADAYKMLLGERGKLLAQIGYKFPRIASGLATVTGLSPGVIRLWHDIESGWMAEARERPEAPPVYRSVPDAVAMAILKKEVTPELEKELLAPVEYYGE